MAAGAAVDPHDGLRHDVAGLTCSAAKIMERTLEAGALVLQIKVCCTTNLGDRGRRAAIHEAMEQRRPWPRRASSARSRRCAVMACANPKGGVFDSRGLVRAAAASVPVVAFDVILVVVDAPDASWDRGAAQILNSSTDRLRFLDPLAATARWVKRSVACRPAPGPRSPAALRRLRPGAVQADVGDHAARGGLLRGSGARRRPRTGDDPCRALSDWLRPTRPAAARVQRRRIAARPAGGQVHGENAVFAAETNLIAEPTVPTTFHYLASTPRVSAALGLGGEHHREREPAWPGTCHFSPGVFVVPFLAPCSAGHKHAASAQRQPGPPPVGLL